jgi:hypothetical protein
MSGPPLQSEKTVDPLLRSLIKEHDLDHNGRIDSINEMLVLLQVIGDDYSNQSCSLLRSQRMDTHATMLLDLSCESFYTPRVPTPHLIRGS